MKTPSSLITAFATLLCLCSCSITGQHPAAQVTAVEIVDFGTFKMSGPGVKVVDTSVSGSHSEISGSSRKITKRSAQVVAGKGVTFGVLFRADGTPPGGPATVESRLIHPPMTNPETRKTATEEKLSISTTLGTARADVFTFERDWELVPGKWVQQYYVGGKLLAEKSFEVVLGSKAHRH